MSLVKRNENYPVWPGFFSDFFSRDWYDWSNRNFSLTNTTLPSVNIKETKDAFEVEVAVPGLAKEDFKVELDNNLLTISSEKSVRNEDKVDGKYTSREFSYQSFSRSFALPGIVERDKITANYNNGILSIVIPKLEEAKPKPLKQITIS